MTSLTEGNKRISNGFKRALGGLAAAGEAFNARLERVDRRLAQALERSSDPAQRAGQFLSRARSSFHGAGLGAGLALRRAGEALQETGRAFKEVERGELRGQLAETLQEPANGLLKEGRAAREWIGVRAARAGLAAAALAYDAGQTLLGLGRGLQTFATEAVLGAREDLRDAGGFILAAGRRAFHSPWALALIYLFDLAVAELMTTLVAPRAGMIAHGIVFGLLLAHASLAASGPLHKFLLTLALAPLIRVLSLAMPLIHFQVTYWYLVVGLPLFIAAFITARQAELNRENIALQVRQLPWQLLIGFFGIWLGLAEYLILRPQPIVATFSWETVLMPALILLIFTGFLEELIFRGMLQYTAVQQLGRWGLLFVALLFAVLHLGYRSVLDVLFVFGVALIFGLLVPRPGGSLLGVTLAHGLTNISLYLVFPFLLAAPLVGANQAPNGAPPDILAPAALVTPNPDRLLSTPFLAATPTARPTASPTLLPPTATPTWDVLATRHAVLSQTPPPPTPTPTATPCTPPEGWVAYRIVPGDSLTDIGLRYRVEAWVLRQANCLGDPQALSLALGQVIYVPNVVPRYPATPTEPPVEKPKDKPGPTSPAPTEEPTRPPTEPPPPPPTPEPTKPPPPPPTPAPTNPPPPTPVPTDLPPPPTPAPPL